MLRDKGKTAKEMLSTSSKEKAYTVTQMNVR